MFCNVPGHSISNKAVHPTKTPLNLIRIFAEHFLDSQGSRSSFGRQQIPRSVCVFAAYTCDLVGNASPWLNCHRLSMLHVLFLCDMYTWASFVVVGTIPQFLGNCCEESLMKPNWPKLATDLSTYFGKSFFVWRFTQKK